MLLTMENKNIEFSVDPREYQMALIMTLPKNTPKAAMKVIRELQKERDFLLEIKRHRDLLLEENKKSAPDCCPSCMPEYIKELEGEIEDLKEENEELKQNQLTEDSAMEYIYENSDKYEDWIEGSTIYNDLKEKLIEEVEWIGSENKELKKEIEDLKKD